MEDIYKNLSISFYNRFKNTINGSVKCTVNEPEDKLYIEIARLGLIYKTSIENVKDILDDEAKQEIEFDKVIKKYRSFVNHKFFY